jgi:anaerobic magnesium-protoporphyrin IX monomethyl ester cyclase
MKVLLVNCCPVKSRTKEARTHTPPLHLGYLAAILERQGLEAAIVDMSTPNCSLDTIKDTITAYRPDLVGLSSITPSFSRAIATARLIKHIAPTVPIVAGGCHVTFTADSTLRENPEIDIVVRGEGEATLLELIKCMEAGGTLDKVRGLSYRRDGNDPFHTPARPYISDLDTLPWPARHLMLLLEYGTPGAILASRGCPNRCIFCAASAMSGHRYRVRQPHHVVDEIEHLGAQYGLRNFLFLDDTFTALPEQLTIPVCQEITSRRLGITFGCESRVDAITPHLIEHLVQAGAQAIQLGIESGSQEILDKIGKRITLHQVYNAVRWALDAGLRVACCFMLGHPDETEETARQTAELMKKVRAMGVAVTPLSVFTPFPGTDVYERPERYGVRREELDWKKFTTFCPVFKIKHLSLERLRELYVEISCDLVPAEAAAGKG